VWLEAARLQTPDNAKALLARGVAANPTSVKLWIQARLPHIADHKICLPARWLIMYGSLWRFLICEHALSLVAVREVFGR
jgi:hypothetical protein